MQHRSKVASRSEIGLKTSLCGTPFRKVCPPESLAGKEGQLAKKLVRARRQSALLPTAAPKERLRPSPIGKLLADHSCFREECSVQATLKVLVALERAHVIFPAATVQCQQGSQVTVDSASRNCSAF